MAKKKSKKAATKSKASKAKSKKRSAPKTKKAASKKGNKKAASKKPVKKKVARKPVAKKKTSKKAVKKKPLAKKAVAKKSTRKPVAKKPVTKKPVARKALVSKPIAKKPVAKKPVTKKPAPQPIEKKSDTQTQEAPVVQQEASVSEHRESFTPHATSLKAGDPAPHFSGVDQNGNTVSLDDFKDKTLILYFYPKDDTEGCTAQSCSLRDEYEHLGKENHAVVGVSADDVDSHKHFADKFSLPFPLIADTSKEIIKAYDVWGKKRLFDNIYDGIVRTTFIIKDNTIQRVITSVDTKNHGKQVMEA